MKEKFTLVVLITVVLLLTKPALSQFVRIADRVIVAGYVFEESTGEPLPYVNVYVKKSRSGTITDTLGYFLLNATINDTIIFSSLGYDRKYVILTDSATDKKEPLIVFMDTKVYEIRSVEVISLRKYKQLEYEITNMRLPDDEFTYAANNFPFRSPDIDYYTRGSTPMQGIGMVFSPITALYDMFSKEGKEKQKLAELQGKDYLNSLIEEKISAALVMKITGLNQSETNAFLEWCNFSPEFVMKLTEYDLVSVIVYKYKLYENLR